MIDVCRMLENIVIIPTMMYINMVYQLQINKNLFIKLIVNFDDHIMNSSIKPVIQNEVHAFL